MKYFYVDRQLLLKPIRKEIKHRIWLYLYVSTEDDWTPEGAARELNIPIATVKKQARELATMNYIQWDEAFYKHARKQNIPTKLKWEVWERDNFTCIECGKRRFLSCDHILPESKGGLTERDNLQTLCKSCNSSKGVR